MLRETFDSEARLSYVLAALAGVLGATAFTHSAGYFVTFMTGNAQRAVLGYFRDDVMLSISAGLLIVAFVSGVVVASVCRRHFWVAHPHGPTVLTTVSLFAATVVDVFDLGWDENELDFPPIFLVAFGIGALNTSFVKDGEVSVPLSYVTGTLVKMGQGIERHIAGGRPVGLARLLSAVRQLHPGRHGRWRHQPDRQRYRHAGRRFCGVRGDDRIHLLPSRPPRVAELATRTRTSAAARGVRCCRCIGGIYQVAP